MPKGFQHLITCEGETQNNYNYKCAVDGIKHFKNQKQYHMFVRLHRKKCKSCCEANPNPSKSNLEFQLKQDLTYVMKNGSNVNERRKMDSPCWKEMENSLK